jgi:hypothetical protein
MMRLVSDLRDMLFSITSNDETVVNRIYIFWQGIRAAA